jgi:hypothetical protein
MPSNEIMSVEGQLVGMPLAGPESFSQQQLDYLKRALGVDETVLYESSTAVAQNGTFSLSEATTNFDRIRIYIAHAQNVTNWSVVVEYTGIATRYDIVMNVTDNANSIVFDRFYFSRSGTTITVGARKRHSITGSTCSSSDLTNPALVMKIVGVHRIAGGN